MSNDEVISLINTLNTELDKKTKGYINELKKNNNLLKEFKLSNVENLSDLIDESKEICGIYYFQIKFNDDIPQDDTKADFLISEWKKNKRENIPPIIKMNIDNTIKRGQWIPFYLGKCQEVYKRLEEHLVGKSTTSSLRLKQIENGIFRNAAYKISKLNLDEFKGSSYWVVSKIEKNIRKELKPICGK